MNRSILRFQLVIEHMHTALTGPRLAKVGRQSTAGLKRYVDGGRMSVHRFLINRPFRVYPGVGEGSPLHCVNDHMGLHQVGVEG